MVRRVLALAAIALFVSLLLGLIWRVYLHHNTTAGPDDLSTVGVRVVISARPA